MIFILVNIFFSNEFAPILSSTVSERAIVFWDQKSVQVSCLHTSYATTTLNWLLFQTLRHTRLVWEPGFCQNSCWQQQKKRGEKRRRNKCIHGRGGLCTTDTSTLSLLLLLNLTKWMCLYAAAAAAAAAAATVCCSFDLESEHWHWQLQQQQQQQQQWQRRQQRCYSTKKSMYKGWRLN